MRLRITCILAATGLLASAQQGTIAGPSAGYVFDPGAKVVRQVRGIAGASVIGDAVDFGMAISAATISPRGDSAAVIAGDGSLHLFRLAGGAAKEMAAANAMSAPGRVAYSPSGSAIVLSGAGNLQVLTGLPDAATSGRTFAVQSTPEVAAAARTRAGAGAMAVSDDGVYVLVQSGSSVWLVSGPGMERILMEARGAAALAFAPASHDAAVASGGTLSVFRDVAGASTHQDFPNAPSGAVAFSSDGARLVLAGMRSVMLLDRATGEAKQSPCECRVAGLTAMGDFFRLNDPGDGPLWLVDSASAEPRLVFVPAL